MCWRRFCYNGLGLGLLEELHRTVVVLLLLLLLLHLKLRPLLLLLLLLLQLLLLLHQHHHLLLLLLLLKVHRQLRADDILRGKHRDLPWLHHVLLLLLLLLLLHLLEHQKLLLLLLLLLELCHAEVLLLLELHLLLDVCEGCCGLGAVRVVVWVAPDAVRLRRFVEQDGVRIELWGVHEGTFVGHRIHAVHLRLRRLLVRELDVRMRHTLPHLSLRRHHNQLDLMHNAAQRTQRDDLHRVHQCQPRPPLHGKHQHIRVACLHLELRLGADLQFTLL